MAGDRVGPGLAGLLVKAAVSIGGEGATLTGFKVHYVLADGPAFQAQGGFLSLFQGGEAEPETLVGGFGAAYRLENQIYGRPPLFDGFEGVGHVRKHARLSWNVVALDYFVDHGQ